MGTPDYSAGTIKLEGARELRRTLRQAGDDLSDLKDLNKRTATTVARAADGRVPTLTGRLAASVRGAGTKTAAIVRAGKKSVPYAHAIHWGRHFWPYRDSPRAVPSPITARPFLSEAAQATETTWVAYYEDELDKIISRVEGK